MRPRLYLNEICPCARAVVLTAKVLDLTLELKEVQWPCKGLTKCCSPPQTVPILEDSGYAIWDSHSIIAYLVGKYGMDDSLYPREPYRRALIDERLHFDSGVLSFFSNTILNSAIRNPAAITDEQIECLLQTYEVVENFFTKDTEWIAGDSLTIADLCLIPSITSLNVIVPIDEKKFPKLIKWIKKAETMPFYKENVKGLEKLKAFSLNNYY